MSAPEMLISRWPSKLDNVPSIDDHWLIVVCCGWHPCRYETYRLDDQGVRRGSKSPRGVCEEIYEVRRLHVDRLSELMTDKPEL